MAALHDRDDHDIRAALANASLDAPRRDLWERIEPAIVGMRVQRRRPFISALQGAAAILAIFVTGAVMLAIFSLADDRDGAATDKEAIVPDLLLLSGWNSVSRTQSLLAYLPGSSDVRTVVDGVNVQVQPIISPDGRQLVYTASQEVNGEWETSMWALDSTTLATRWSVMIATEPITTEAYGPSISTDIAMTDDTVYVAAHRWESDEPYTIRAFDSETGEQTAATEIDLGGNGANPSLYASGDAVYLLTTSVSDSARLSRSGWVRLNPDDLTEQSRTITTPDESEPAFGNWETWPTPDGKSIYTIGVFAQGEPMVLAFLDLTSGEVLPPIPLPFDNQFDFTFERAISPDGTELYLFNPSSGEIAIVDLTTRALDRTVQVDMSRVQASRESILGRVWGAVRGVFVQDAAAKVYFQGAMQFSPDGSRLYAIGLSGDGLNGEPNGVLVIDTVNWQVVEHWLPDSNPTQVLLSGDGRYLYVQDVDWGGSGRTDLLVVGTGNGEALSSDDAPGGLAYSLVELYRNTYGRTPAVAGVDSSALRSDGVLDSTLPFASLTAIVTTDTIISGESVTIEARYLDPETGEPVREGVDSYRFDRPDLVRAELTRDGLAGEPVTVVLTESSYGLYRGSAMLTEPGIWSVKVVARREGEPSRNATAEGAVSVQPTMQGTDGRAYILLATTEPAKPEVDQPVTLRVTIVDAETRTPLPDGVEIEGGLPETMDGSIFRGGVTSRTLNRVGNSEYVATFEFWSSGTWTVQVDFPGDGMRSGSVRVGVVEVR